MASVHAPVAGHQHVHGHEAPAAGLARAQCVHLHGLDKGMVPTYRQLATEMGLL